MAVSMVISNIFNVLHVAILRTCEKRVPVQSSIVCVIAAKGASETFAVCVAVIGNTNVMKS
jgi:hypothetical protein